MECANCARRYSPYFANANWCRFDGVLVCRTCLGEGRTCPACGTQVSALGSILVGEGAVFLLLVGPICAVLVALPGWLSHHWDTTTLLDFGITLGVPAAVLLAGIVVSRRHLALHDAHLPSWTAKRPKALAGAPATDLITWIDNRYLQGVRRGILALNLTNVGLLAVFLIVVFSPIAFPPLIFVPVLVGIPAVLLLTALFGGVFGWSMRQGVDRVGVSGAGVYFDYRHPPRSARSFLAWTDVRELEAPLATSRHSVKFDTPLGSEYLSYLDSTIIDALQQRFREGHAAGPGRPTTRPASGGVLSQAAAPSSAADTSWEFNSLRRRWIRLGVVGTILEVPVLVLFLLYFLKYGANQGVALFFLPASYGLTTIYQGYIAPREIGVSSVGFSVRERGGERTIPWDEVAELTPGSRGFRYKTPTGFAEWISRVDADQVGRVVTGLVRARGLDPSSPPTQPPSAESSWVVNPLHRSAARLSVLMVAAPAATIGASALVFLFVAANPNLILSMVLPLMVLIPAIVPIVIWRSSPTRIASAGGAVFADYSGRTPGPGSLRWVPLSSVDSVKPSSRTPRGLGSTGARDFGLRSVSLTFRTRAGVNLTLGPISPSVAKIVGSQLSSSQLAEWKP